jgi:hypothetical protein
MTQKTNPWTFDVRVRERNLKAGTVTEKDVEKYIGGLPDLADQSEAFGTSQPALAQPVAAAIESSSNGSDADLGADEEDDEDDDTSEPADTADRPE